LSQVLFGLVFYKSPLQKAAQIGLLKNGDDENRFYDIDTRPLLVPAKGLSAKR
jgi:hypothetical protein